MGTAVELINGWILPVAVSPIIGSFLGVLIRRLPAGRPVALGRSACEACGHVLTPAEMVPIASYLRQRGRCAACGARISADHLYIELAALGVAIAAAVVVPGGPYLWVSCVLGWWLLALAWIDARNFRLPDVLTLPLIAAGLAEAAWLEPEALTDRAVATAAAFAALWLVARAYRMVRGREGLGLGDVKLMAAAGAWVGIALLPIVMLAGALLGLAYGGAQWLRGAKLGATTKLPFGPFLAAAIWGVWLWRP
jgi:leader peptidase (prepilin peptidase) / N-methyltransferase